MKSIFKRFTDVVGHLPDNFKPKEEVKPKLSLPTKEGKKGFRILVFDMDAPCEEGMSRVPVWDHPIPVALVNGLIGWVKTQAIALQYRMSMSGDPYTHDQTGRIRERIESPTSLLSSLVASWDESRQGDLSRNRVPLPPANAHAERARQLADEIRARGIDPYAPVDPEAIDVSSHGHPHEEVSRGVGDFPGRITNVVVSNPETLQRWARERWEQSMAGRAGRAQSIAEIQHERNLEDIKLANEADPDRNNKTPDEPPKSE